MEKAFENFTEIFYSGSYQESLTAYRILKKETKRRPRLRTQVDNCGEFKQLTNECKLIDKLVGLMLETNWSQVRAQDSIFIETQILTDDFFIKVKFTINFPPLSVFAVLFETDLLGTWVDTISTSQVLFEASSYRKRIKYRYNLPWPLNNRQSILDCCLIPIPELHTALIILFTPPELTTAEEDKNFIEMRLPGCGVWVRGMGDECEVTICLQANAYIVRDI